MMLGGVPQPDGSARVAPAPQRHAPGREPARPGPEPGPGLPRGDGKKEAKARYQPTHRGEERCLIVHGRLYYMIACDQRRVISKSFRNPFLMNSQMIVGIETTHHRRTHIPRRGKSP